MHASARRLVDSLDHIRAAVDVEISRLAAEPVAAASRSEQALAYALAAAGKRIRPLLCIAAFRAIAGTVQSTRRDGTAGEFGEVAAPLLRLGCAVELIHTYSLMHDDLPCMDDAPLRRNRPTAHVLHGSVPAMVAGLALIPRAFALLDQAAQDLGLTPETRALLAHELATGAGAAGMVGGQLMDLEAERRRLSAAELEQLQARKTGALLIAALRVGARAAGATTTQLEALTAYGCALGLAFQIADDLLDVTGREAVTGKAAGTDQALEKATFPALLGVDAARRRGWELVQSARDALAPAGLDTPELLALAQFAMDRNR
ncbi:MAG: polyprenyl synthetase family protein [Longimicrobiales bacterium]